MNASNTVAALPLIDSTTEEEILTALRALHGAVAAHGAQFPSFDAMLADAASPSGDKGLLIERIASRAYRALGALNVARREERIAKFRQGIADVVSPYVDEKKEARDAFLALPSGVRKFLPAFGSTVEIPVEAVSSVFPSGTPVESMVKVLHGLNYKISKTAGKLHIVAELPTK
jgi:hypothetical protein